MFPTISANLPAIVGGWGWTDLIFKLPSARLKVLEIKVIDFGICIRKIPIIEIYHVCAGGMPGVFNQGTCYVYNHFTLFIFNFKNLGTL
jgi:hypothetical protein